MRILSRVCARFENPRNNSITYSIENRDRLVLRDAPDWLAQTALFNWLVSDGTIEVVGYKDKEKLLQNDPIQGAAPDGSKRVENEQEVDFNAEAEAIEEAQKPKRTRKKSVKAAEAEV